MDTNAKNLAYNNSSYAQWQAQKQAIYNASKYGQASSAASSSSTGSTSSTGMTYYTLPNGKVLARNTESKFIDFKSLFSFLDDDESGYNSSTGAYSGIGNYQTIADSLFDAYAKRAKQNLNL
jgi:hypothetical protein